MYLTPVDGRSSTRAFMPFAGSTATCMPLAVRRQSEAQVSLLGSPAVSISVRTAPLFELPVYGRGTTKINNSISTSAEGAGLAASAAAARIMAAAWDQQAQVDKVKGAMAAAIDARGVPPRGRPV